MRLKLSWVLILVVTFLFFGPPRIFAETTANSPTGTNAIPHCARWHTIQVKPRDDLHLAKIHFYDKLNPVWWFKNRDDPKPPNWYKPNDTHRNLKWGFRNPMHNFDFYVIGVADKKFARSGRFPNKSSDPRGGWDFEAARYRFIWLPFISYHRTKFDFYLGWRDRGNFGIKININPDRKPKPKTAPVVATKASVRTQ